MAWCIPGRELSNASEVFPIVPANRCSFVHNAKDMWRYWLGEFARTLNVLTVPKGLLTTMVYEDTVGNMSKGFISEDTVKQLNQAIVAF